MEGQGKRLVTSRGPTGRGIIFQLNLAAFLRLCTRLVATSSLIDCINRQRLHSKHSSVHQVPIRHRPACDEALIDSLVVQSRSMSDRQCGVESHEERESSAPNANMVNFLDNGPPPPPPPAAIFAEHSSGDIAQSRPGFLKRYNERYTPARPDPWWQMKLGVGYVSCSVNPSTLR